MSLRKVINGSTRRDLPRNAEIKVGPNVEYKREKLEKMRIKCYGVKARK